MIGMNPHQASLAIVSCPTRLYLLIYFDVCSNQPTRIPKSCSYYYSVTKTVTWRYLGNQAWYHRSAGVKTTGKILNKKFQKKRKEKGKMVKIGQNSQRSEKE